MYLKLKIGSHNMKTQTNRAMLGLDLGNTIVETTSDGKFPFDDAIRVIHRLVTEVFTSQRVFIVSRVNEEQYKRARAWIQKENLLERTGILEENIHWCAERNDKAPICEKLGITHFIDDRPEVLSYMSGIVPHRILFQASEDDILKFKDSLHEVTHVTSWREIEKIFFPTD